MLRRFVCWPIAALVLIVCGAGCDRGSKPAASEELPLDEAAKAATEKGVSFEKYARDYFYPKQIENYFKGMDLIAEQPPGRVQAQQLADLTPMPALKLADPITPPAENEEHYKEKAALHESEVLGRNSWMIWCGGNEAFWDWISTDTFGFIDLLKLLDSRNRATRFRDAGMINEPEMAAASSAAPNEFGLWLDLPADEKAREWRAQYVAEAFGEAIPRWTKARKKAAGGGAPAGYSAGGGAYTSTQPTREYKTSDSAQGGSDYGGAANKEAYELKIPPPAIYGLSSGVVGLRLFPNPNFINNKDAQRNWDPDRFFNDPNYYNDPNLIRPYRVGMACSFCHASFHPLNPPPDLVNPKWTNISGNIGAQYLRVRAVFANLLTPESLIYHVLDSQPPGTIDTSLIASDNINNTNAMNPVFGVPARVVRSLELPQEQLTHATAGQPSLWGNPAGLSSGSDYGKMLDYEKADVVSPLLKEAFLEKFGIEHRIATSNSNPRYVPRILFDGADSVGAWIALARVYLNIGTYNEQWRHLHTPVVGITPQRPFKIADCEQGSVYWHATKLRVGPLRDYFLKVTPPMPLLAAGRPFPAAATQPAAGPAASGTGGTSATNATDATNATVATPATSVAPATSAPPPNAPVETPAPDTAPPQNTPTPPQPTPPQAAPAPPQPTAPQPGAPQPGAPQPGAPQTAPPPQPKPSPGSDATNPLLVTLVPPPPAPPVEIAERLKPIDPAALRAKAKDASDADFQKLLATERARRIDTTKLARGRRVFAQNCIVCHSSVQPESHLAEARPDLPPDEAAAKAKKDEISRAGTIVGAAKASAYVDDWRELATERRNDLQKWAAAGEFWDHHPARWLADGRYIQWAYAVVQEPEFWTYNYLATDYRIPVNQVGTNSARAMATNAMSGHMWEDFSSASYQRMPSVGAIDFFNPYPWKDAATRERVLGKKAPAGFVDRGGQNAAYFPRHKAPDGVGEGGGGPGFYRVPTLISVWATAPLLHNNSLGLFNNDPSVDGRLEAFDDAMRKMLWPAKRVQISPNDKKPLNGATTARLQEDRGLIWRTPQKTWVTLSGKYAAAMAERLPGVMQLHAKVYRWFPTLRTGKPAPVPWWPSVVLLAVAAGLLFLGRKRLALLAAALAVIVWVFLWVVYSGRAVRLPWLPSAVLIVSAFLLLSRARLALTRLVAYCLLLVALLFGAFLYFSAGHIGIRIGPFPEGTPVNLIVNINPEAPPEVVKRTIGYVAGKLGEIESRHLLPADRAKAMREEVAPALMEINKCPDFVMDRGHYFPWFDNMTDDDKEAVIELLKTF